MPFCPTGLIEDETYCAGIPDLAFNSNYTQIAGIIYESINEKI